MTKTKVGFLPLSGVVPAGLLVEQDVSIDHIDIKAIQLKATEATALWEEDQNLTSPSLICITNLGPNTIYYGGRNVSTINGIPILANGVERLGDVISKNGIIYLIAGTADQATPLDTRIAIFAKRKV